MTTNHKYGWTPDRPDHRDLKFAPRMAVAALPRHVDLREKCPPIYNQAALGSCTANAIAAAIDFERNRQGEPFISPSRLFIYYNERQLEGSVEFDSGACIRDGIKTIVSLGACAEALWPYSIDQFTVKPPEAAYTAALDCQTLQYRRVDNTDLNQIRSALAQGTPVVFGFTVYESFEAPTVATSGVMLMPAGEERALGGHAVLAVGYDDDTLSIIVRNSWGTGWGQQGHFLMPYSYITNPDLADDFWVIERVE